MTSRRVLLQRLAAMGMIGAMASGLALPQEVTDRAMWRRQLLQDAWRSAAASGRPLLAIVIPEDETARWVQADSWGEVISHGSDEAIAALAAAELVCATQAELAELLPLYVPVQPEPTLVRLDVGMLPVRQAYFHVTLPTIARPAAAEGENQWDLDERHQEEVVSARIAVMEAMIFRLVQPTAASRGADLAARRSEPVTGSRWKRSMGCGSWQETPDPLVPDEQDMGMMIGCGMGHVNARSARFLDFLTKEPVVSDFPILIEESGGH